MPPLPKWSNKTIERFLDIYKKHPCLYDFEDVCYASRLARHEAMESILRELAIPGLSLLDLKRKIHSIRNTYTNECRKIERSKKTAAYPEQYKPRSPWFYVADKFLAEIVLSRKDRRASNNDFFNKVQAINLQNLGVPADHQEEYSSPSEAHSSSSDSNYRNKTTSMFEPAALANAFREAKSSTSTSRSYQQSTTTVTVAPSTILENALFTIPEVQCKEESLDFKYETLADPYEEEHSDMISFQNVEDELETFARSVWLQMRRLPEEYNIQLMADIQTLISDKRREYLQTQTKYVSTSQEKKRQALECKLFQVSISRGEMNQSLENF